MTMSFTNRSQPPITTTQHKTTQNEQKEQAREFIIERTLCTNRPEKKKKTRIHSQQHV
jgi:hypothetical protein